MSEVRYASLTKIFPERAKELFEKAEEDAKERYESTIGLQNYRNLKVLILNIRVSTFTYFRWIQQILKISDLLMNSNSCLIKAGIVNTIIE